MSELPSLFLFFGASINFGGDIYPTSVLRVGRVYVVCVAVYVSTVSTGIWPKASRVSCLGLLHNLRLTTYSLLPHTSNLISADLFKLGTCRYAIIISCGMERGGERISPTKMACVE